MRKKIAVMPLIFVLLICTCACSSEKNGLKVTAGQRQINVFTASSKHKNVFEPAFGKNAFAIAYIKTGEKLYIDFQGKPPDAFTIADYLLDSNGGYRYSGKLAQSIAVSAINDRYYFVLKKHIASALNNVHKSNNKNFRGFKVTASTGKNARIYIFVLKTDGYDT
jgi:hypothetical protein